MKKKTVLWLSIATVFVLLGCSVFVAAMTGIGWNFEKLSLATYETNTYTVSEDFTAIDMDTLSADIRFLPATDESCTVVLHEKESVKHTVSVENGILKVTAVDTREWYDYLFSFGKETVTVYLPKSSYLSLQVENSTGNVEIPTGFTFGSINVSLSTGDLFCNASASDVMSIEASTGNISVRSLSAKSLSLKTTTGNIALSDVTVMKYLRVTVSTGRISISDAAVGNDVYITVSTGESHISGVTARHFTSTGGTGDITLRDVIASKNMEIKRTTGDVEFSRCDAETVTIKTSTGDVEGSFLTGKTVVPHTSTGDIDIPHGTSGGRCEITTSTGDIEIEIAD